MAVLRGPEILKPKGQITDVRVITLKDGSKGTFYPIYFDQVDQYPESLFDYLFKQFNDEVVRGDTYPNLHELETKQEFLDYWFGAFHALLIKGQSPVLEETSDWDDLWLGSFYIKPNYIGRCSHVCNAGFLVNPLKRGAGIGKVLGENYLVWAPILGYTYSVFNLVFESNPASHKIWDSLGFDRIGRVPGVAILKGHDEPVDAIIFGKKLM